MSGLSRQRICDPPTHIPGGTQHECFHFHPLAVVKYNPYKKLKKTAAFGRKKAKKYCRGLLAVTDALSTERLKR